MYMYIHISQAFFAFREGCIGRGSTKHTRRERRALMERKRAEIAENNFRVTGLRLLATEVGIYIHKIYTLDANTHIYTYI